MARLLAVLLVLAGAALPGATPAAGAAPLRAVEAETLAPGEAGTSYADPIAAGGRALLLWSEGSVRATLTAAAPRRLEVVAAADLCDGPPRLEVRVDGELVLSQLVTRRSWTRHGVDLDFGPGPHEVAVSFVGDHLRAGCDRNLRVDRVALLATPSDPLAGRQFYVAPDSAAANEAARRRAAGDGAAAAAFDRIAAGAQPEWLGDWNPVGTVAATARARVSAARVAGAVPVLVAYAIPERDCSGWSGGGAAGPEAYRAWVEQFAAGVGEGPAVVVLEPDALAQLDCLSPAAQTARLGLLADAVHALTSRRGVSVYLDAGHAAWQPAEVMAARLTAAGVARARGFALNTSGFGWTGDQVSYGDRLSGLLRGQRYVVDTSRNGAGPAPDLAWCNPPGRALGTTPTATTASSRADAYLWVKRPGESDGECGRGEPAAGVWWPEHALGLAQRAP